MIRTLEELSAWTHMEAASMADALRDDVVIDRADGAEATRLASRMPSLPRSFLDVVRRWTVLGKSFTRIDLFRADEIEGTSGEVFGLDADEFISIGSNGSGDPVGVSPVGAAQSAAGSILHFNHDSDVLAIVAPDLETLVIGLGNYGECWDADEDEPELAAGRQLEERLLMLGWPDDLRRFWPARNESGLFD